MAKLITVTRYVSEITPEMIAEGWVRSDQSAQSNSATPVNVYLCSNGNVSCFDAEGQQIGELQHSWMETWLNWMEEKGVDPTKLNIQTIVNGKEKYVQPFKTSEGNWNWSFVDF